jgi:chromosome partitioning protein
LARIIAITNLKGGVGKTTTVVNLGAGLALKGARVLLVDVDAQGNLSAALGLQPRHTLYEVLVEGKPAAACITPARDNLDVLAADPTLLGAQPDIARRPDWSRVLDQGLRPALGSYDFVLIDCGGSLTTLNLNALMAASDVIVPTAIEFLSIRGIELLSEQVARVKGTSNSMRLIVPTMFDPRQRQATELLDELRQRYHKRVAPPIRVNVRLSEAPSLGRTIYEYDPRSRGAADYAQLVEQVSALFGFEAPTRPPRHLSLTHKAQAAWNGHAHGAQAKAPVVTGEVRPLEDACPNCKRPLRQTTLAGYLVVYCEHCRYNRQELAQGVRR